MPILKKKPLCYFFYSFPLKIIFSQKGHQRASNAFTKWAGQIIFRRFCSEGTTCLPTVPTPLYRPTSRRKQCLRIEGPPPPLTAQIRNIVFDRLIWPSECVGCVQVYFMWKSYFSKTVPSPSSFLWWRRLVTSVTRESDVTGGAPTDRRNRTRFACEHFELKQQSVLATSKATQTSLMSTTQQIWAPKICPDFDGSTLTAKNNLKSTKLSGIIWLQKY